ncbi:hypothetical protein SEA_ORLA_30 [Gordonia phage Orla]|nr:hypothetical protein SEA_ORLA_30 [Gordonia phage Orla]
MAGFNPNEDNLILSSGADFVATYVERGAEWPDGTTVTMSFPTLTGVGPYIGQNVIHARGAAAAVRIPRTDTTPAKMPARTPYTLHLEKSGTRYLWFRGRVERQD